MKSFELYSILKKYYGEVGSWWPKDHPFEVIVGAILTQQSTWINVEKALKNLKDENILTPLSLVAVPLDKLKELIRPSGFFNQKAERLKKISEYLMDQYDGNIELFFNKDKKELREELLKLNGIGHETADSILLYSAEKIEFVVDAYTKRIYSRLGLVNEKIDYENLKKYIINEFPEDLIMYQEYHGLLVIHGKNLCIKNNPKCNECPLKKRCKYIQNINS